MPWELLATEEPDLTADLAQLLLSRDLIIANPAYTMLFQSKAILAWLWQCYPNHPLLLESRLGQPLPGHCIRKPVMGREGQDVAELQGGLELPAEAGDYADQAPVYQRYAQLPHDAQSRLYQAGVFWAGSACAVGMRRAQGFINNLSEFVPHVIS